MIFSGLSPDRELVEFVELPREVHPYYVSTQAHPELSSRPTRPHPLFAGLVKAALDHQGNGHQDANHQGAADTAAPAAGEPAASGTVTAK